MEIERRSVYDLDFSSLLDEITGLGEPAYRAEQIWSGLYKHYWENPAEFTNLPSSLRRSISDRFDFSRLNPIKWVESKDRDTRKTLFHLSENQAIEAVLMRYRTRRTLCISSQAGCAMGCVFCATGQMGYKRNLSSGEIVQQVIYYARYLAAAEERVTNVVIMGMGEPFHNYEATMAAIDRLNDPKGFNFGARRFTISTVGLVPAIRRFTQENRQVNLAISLHAADNQLRSTLLPVNKKYPLESLMHACLDYVTRTNRRISFEWALIQGVNDGQDQAAKLATLLQPFLWKGSPMCHVNVIPLNPTRDYSGKATSRTQAFTFQSVLEGRGIPCTVRIRRGIDIQAGCGQLATE